MSSKQTRTRIMAEIKDMKKNPPDGITACPLEQDLFEWHFTIKGADDTEFKGGRYHGKFVLPATYPMKAPDVIMFTKSGRFEIGKKICLNFTGYHHELWQPAWTIRTMLTALRAFMETPAQGVGAISVDKNQRKKYAKQSLNYQCPKCGVKMSDVVFVENKKKQKKDNEKTENNDNENDEIEIINNSDYDNNQPKQTVNDIQTNSNNNDNDDIGNNKIIPQNMDGNSIQNDVDEKDENDEKTSTSEQNQPNGINHSNIPNVPSRKDRLLDNFTVLLVIIIIGILFKKFALRFIEQL